MKKIVFILVSLLLASLGSNARSLSNGTVVNENLVTISVQFQLSAGITDLGSRVQYYKNGQLQTEYFTPGIMSHTFYVDQDSYFTVSFLIEGGDTLTIQSSSTEDDEIISYQSPSTDQRTYWISGPNSFIFNFSYSD